MPSTVRVPIFAVHCIVLVREHDGDGVRGRSMPATQKRPEALSLGALFAST